MAWKTLVEWQALLFPNGVMRRLWRALLHPRQGLRTIWVLLRTLKTGGIDGLRTLLNQRPADQALLQTSYQNWLAAYDNLSPEDRKAIARHIAAMKRRVVFSILVPVYNTPEQWLRRVIDSVQEQIWPYWELCIADDCSSQPHVRAILEHYAARDVRIKLAFRTQNGHISAASNSALALATGEYVALLDHDDELPPHALYMVAAELEAHPEAMMIYSDEDKIDRNGLRFDPYFKSDWNPDLQLSHNMVSHLGVYETRLLKEIGGFRSDYDGSQDYDLALRYIRRLRVDQIRHIPHILYHWRAIPGSTALGPTEKSYPYEAARQAISDHLTALGQGAALVTQAFVPVLHRVIYPTPNPAPTVTIIIPTRDRLDLLKPCVDSVLTLTAYQPYRIVIIDNQSQEEETRLWLAEQAKNPRISVQDYNFPYNYADMNNRAAEQADSEILVFLNNDIEAIAPGWLEEMVSHALRPDIGAVGARLLFPDGRIQHAGIYFHPQCGPCHAFEALPAFHHGYFGKTKLLQNTIAVTAACLAIRKERFFAVGGFDAEHLAIAYNDVDLCLKLYTAGYRNLYTPYAELYHHASASLGAPTTEKRLAQFERESNVFLQRWRAFMDRDPYYSPNLDFSDGDFVPAVPPRSVKPWQKFLG